MNLYGISVCVPALIICVQGFSIVLSNISLSGPYQHGSHTDSNVDRGQK